MKSFLLLSAMLATIIFGVLIGVFFLVSGWTIILVPFWFAGVFKLADYIMEQLY